jgi:hypothetical protein
MSLLNPILHNTINYSIFFISWKLVFLQMKKEKKTKTSVLLLLSKFYIIQIIQKCF